MAQVPDSSTSGDSIEELEAEPTRIEQVQDPLKRFVVYFVELFEKKIADCKKYSALGAVAKTGKITGRMQNLTLKAGTALGAATGMPGAATVGAHAGGKAFEIISKHTGKKSKMKCIRIFDTFRHLSGDEIRKILAQGAGEIFRSFECQFMSATDRSGSNFRGLEKLATDAVERILNYIKLFVAPDCNCQLLTKGVLLGESKKRMNDVRDIKKTGYSIKLIGNPIKTSDLFETWGIVTTTEDGEADVYYNREMSDGRPITGYRRLFSWESLSQYSLIEREKPSKTYTYVLNDESLPNELHEILKEINQKDKDRLYEKVLENNELIKEINAKIMVKCECSKSKESFQATEATQEERNVSTDADTDIHKRSILDIHKKSILDIHKRSILDIHKDLWFDVRAPITLFTGRTRELKELYRVLENSITTDVCHMALVSGLGGIGKTEFVRMFVSIYYKEYNNRIIWINANSYETLSDSFKRLSQSKLNISIKNADGNEKDIKDIIENVYRCFSDGKSLFIFDDAEKRMSDYDEDSGIDTFLPLFPFCSKKYYVIVTSRNCKWGNIQVLSVGTFTTEEAKELIRKALQTQQELPETQVEKLAGKLHSLPLALQQAACYINETNVVQRNLGSEYGIEDYLREYLYRTKALLDYGVPKNGDDIYIETVYTTWDRTIDKISQDKKYGKPAIEILNLIAYISTSEIPAELFLPSEANMDKMMVGNSIELLKQYSMIRPEQDNALFNVHKLVQTVMMLKQKDNSYFYKIFNLLQKLPTRDVNPSVIEKVRKGLPHLEIFLFHVNNKTLLTHDSDEKHILITMMLQIVCKLVQAYLIFGEHKKVKAVSEKALETLNKYYQVEDIDLSRILASLHVPVDTSPADDVIRDKQYDVLIVATILSNLSVSLGALGDLLKKKMLLEHTLSIEEQYYGPTNIAIADTLNNLALAVGELRDHKMSKILLERAIKIKENYFGPDHIDVSTLLNNLALVEGNMNNYEEEKALLNRVLHIKEKVYGPDHIEIAKTLNNLAFALGNLGKYNDKKLLLERVVAIVEKHYGQEHFELALALYNLAEVVGYLGDRNKEKILLERALNMEEKHFGPTNIELAKILNNLALAEGNLGNHESEKELLERALSIKEKHFGRDHIEIAVTLSNLANAHCNLENYSEARLLLERALFIEEKYFGHDNIAIIDTLNNLAETYGMLGNHKEKQEILERVRSIQERLSSYRQY